MQASQTEEAPQRQDQKPIQKVLDEIRIIKFEIDEIRRIVRYIKHQVAPPDFMKIEAEPETEIQDIGWRIW